MQKKLQAKLQERKGFTLVELLIVVAIIAILVAVSIPVYSGYTNNVNVGVDEANERDAMALANAVALTGKLENQDLSASGATGNATTGYTLYYQIDKNSKQGKLVPALPAEGTTGYDEAIKNFQYGASNDTSAPNPADEGLRNEGGYIIIENVKQDSNPTLKWGHI